MATGIAPDLQQMDSLKQLFEDKFSEENRLPPFIKPSALHSFISSSAQSVIESWPKRLTTSKLVLRIVI